MGQISEIVHSNSDGDRQPGGARAGEGQMKVVNFVRERSKCLKECFDSTAFIQCSGCTDDDSVNRQSEPFSASVLVARAKQVFANTVLNDNGRFCPRAGSFHVPR